MTIHEMFVEIYVEKNNNHFVNDLTKKAHKLDIRQDGIYCRPASEKIS